MFVSCAVIIKHMIGGLHLVFFIYTRPYNYTGGTHGQAHTHIIYKRYTNSHPSHWLIYSIPGRLNPNEYSGLRVDLIASVVVF